MDIDYKYKAEVGKQVAAFGSEAIELLLPLCDHRSCGETIWPILQVAMIGALA